MAPPVRGGSWESWQPDLPGRQPLGAARADRLLGGRGRQGKGKKECPEQETNKKKYQGHTPSQSGKSHPPPACASLSGQKGAPEVRTRPIAKSSLVSESYRRCQYKIRTSPRGQQCQNSGVN